MKREAVRSLEARKLSMTTGFWANDGMNDDKGTRRDALEELEQQFTDAVQIIYSGRTVIEEQKLTEEDEKNPFLAPAIKATREIEAPRDDEGTVQQALDSDGADFSTDQDE